MEKIWLKSYPKGVPEEVPESQYRSLRDMLEAAFAEHADKPCYANLGTTLTFADIERLSRQFGAYLQKTLGLTRGERVAIMMPNVLQYPVVLYGILRAGLVVVNVNPLYTARELKHQLSDSGARAIVILENFAHVLEEVIDDTEIEQVMTTRIGDMHPWPRSTFLNFAVKHIKKLVPPFSLPGAITLDHALKQGADQTLEHVEIGLADLAFLQYTGGTTGLSKGAMLSHRNLVYNVEQAIAWTADSLTQFEGEELIAIAALPLYHSFALQANALCIMVQGGLNVLITNPRDFPAFVKQIAPYRFSYFNAVNTMFVALLNTPGFDKLDFSGLRLTIGGGMAVQEPIARKWKEITGTVIVQGYGLTETSPTAVVHLVDSERFDGSIGLPVSSTLIKICDDDGNELPIGELGEICIKGPQVMEGYWKQPEETAKVMLPGGWLRTGDIGRMDQGGFIYIEDRKKDMILVGGFNVYPNEIETVAVELDGVVEAAAVGVPDEKSGERVYLFVVRNKPELTEAQIIEHCRKSLTGYKVPRKIIFRDDLPKTNVGKILRRELREEAIAAASS